MGYPRKCQTVTDRGREGFRLPSLRTVRAVFPHTALQSGVSFIETVSPIARPCEERTARPQTISLVSFMRDRGPVWDRIVKKHNLAPTPYDNIVNWAAGDFVLGCGYDVVSSATKIWHAGFADASTARRCFCVCSPTPATGASFPNAGPLGVATTRLGETGQISIAARQNFAAYQRADPPSSSASPLLTSARSLLAMETITEPDPSELIALTPTRSCRASSIPISPRSFCDCFAT